MLKELRAIVGDANVLDRPVDLQTYEYDAYGALSLPGAVVFCGSTAEVSAVVRLLGREAIPFVPRGYGTNVNGGSLALFGGVVLELYRMNQVLEIDLPNRCVVVQPGIFNADVSTALAAHGYYYAPDPASMKASSIGGNIAENAGGPHCFKYGVTTNHVLGLEVVLPDGEVVWLGGKNADSCGLDLRGVLIGSEGTLGIVTAAVLRILKVPETVKTMAAAFGTLESAGNVVSAIVAAGLIPATLELMDNGSINAVEDALHTGYPREAGAVLLIELDGLSDGMDELAERIAEICRANGAMEVRVARDEDERATLWRGRLSTFPSITRLAPNYMSLDGTVPRTMLPEALRRIGEVAERFDLPVYCVLHAGDGNIHPCFLYDGANERDRHNAEAASMEVLGICAALGGTVSGEHGIGIEKLEAMEIVFSENDLRAQRLVKDAFDPRHMLNPGKLLPEPRPQPAGEAAGPAHATVVGAPVRNGSLLHVAALAARLEDLLGVGRVSMRPQTTICGVKPRAEVAPADVDNLAEVLRMVDEEGLAVCVSGGATKLQWGNPPSRFDVLLRTCDLPAACEVDADDLTLTASASVTVARAQAAARAKGRVLPLDARLPARATLGGVVATGDQGARGAGHGGVRDLMLGVRAVLADGSAVHFGGRTVKNVAGYDMTRLLTGSFGALGVITEMTVKLLPQPESQALMLFVVRSLEEAARMAAGIIDSHLQPLALELLSGRAVAAAGEGLTGPAGTLAEPGWLVAGSGARGRPGWMLFLAGFSGPRAAVDRSVREVRERWGVGGLVLRDSEAEAALDALTADSDDRPAVTTRASVPLSRVWQVAASADRLAEGHGLLPAYRIGCARGVLDLSIEAEAGGAPVAGGARQDDHVQAASLTAWASGVRQAAVEAGGWLGVTDGLGALAPGFDAWGELGPTAGVARAVKERLDPRGTLNPGRLAGGV